MTALTENDIKKIVALSTLSQLGVIIVSISLGQSIFAFFHLCTHALFKALIFLSVGVSIHSVWGSQDLRSYGSLSFGILYPYILLIIASLSLIGFPFISGFYSKDLIAERFINLNISLIFIIIFLVGISLTASYSIKLIKNLISPVDQNIPVLLTTGGSPITVCIPLITLGFLSVTSGAHYSDFLLEESDLFNVFSIWDKIMPLLFILIGTILGLIFKSNSPSSSSIFFLVPGSQLTSALSEGSRILSVDNGFTSS